MTTPEMPGKMPFLIVLDKKGKEAARFLIHEGENYVGIPVEEEGYEPAVDLEPFDGQGVVSRRHAVIRRQGTQCALEHLGKNPTVLNGKSLRTGKSAALSADDDLLFANAIHAKFAVEYPPVIEAEETATNA